MKFSVIIPARDEENSIGQVLDHLRATGRAQDLEIIVVDGQSADRTREIASRKADQVLESPRQGRAAQMNHGARNAKGDILVFQHADTLLPSDWMDLIEEAFRSAPRAAACSFRLRFDRDGWRFRWIEALARARQSWTQVPHGDQGLAVPKKVYEDSGGYPEVPLMEEYAFASVLRRHGFLVKIPASCLTSARRYDRQGPLRTALRNSGLVFLYYCGVSPATLARWYR